MQLTFYFDRCCGDRFPKAIKHANPPFEVEYHHGLGLRPDVKDDKWLSIVGKKGWIVLSHDKKFHRNAPEIASIKQHNIGCFYLTGANSTTWENLENFIRSYRKMEEVVETKKKPFIYRVHKNGSIKKVPVSGESQA